MWCQHVAHYNKKQPWTSFKEQREARRDPKGPPGHSKCTHIANVKRGAASSREVPLLLYVLFVRFILVNLLLASRSCVWCVV